MKNKFQVSGNNSKALFTLKLHRGEGMALVAMNWKKGKPPVDFVGFAIEYKEPGGSKFFALKNRINFPGENNSVNPNAGSTLRSPIQKFRWVHFPRNADLPGEFTYRVTPVFLNERDELSYGEPQQADIVLHRETYPGKLNVTFTRGFVSSQAFVDRYISAGPISKLLPPNADEGLHFVPTHPKREEALAWMGFEARAAILEILDQAIANKKAKVSVIAYDLSEPGIVERFEKLKKRLRIIIDDSGTHKMPDSGESVSAERLMNTAGVNNVKRQHLGQLQHNKVIIVDGPGLKRVVCGSTNFSWRGFFVQANNAVILSTLSSVKVFREAFESYWQFDRSADFGKTPSAGWSDLKLSGISAKVSFSPHPQDPLLAGIADDVSKNTKSSLFFSLAFLYQTPGAMKEAIKKVTARKNLFVYGISDKKVGGLDVQKPNGKVVTVFPSSLSGSSLPEPFKSEPAGGGGNRMHHKFLVVDFDKPTARVYFGSYNFSVTADEKNGENLLLIKDRRIAVSYMIEAIRLFDHYHFRVAQKEARTSRKKLLLKKPPRKPGEKPWWSEYFTDPRKINDRKLFA